MATTSLLWLQLSTPLMYFGIWFILFVAHWMVFKLFKRRGSAKLSTMANYQASLKTHLFEGIFDDDEQEQESEEGAVNLTSLSKHSPSSDDVVISIKSGPANFSRWCKRFRFLRALEFLLLFSYESLTEQALQLINCVGVGSCGRVLAEYPDVFCPTDSSYVPLLVVAILILVYSAIFPVFLFLRLRHLQQQQQQQQHQQQQQQQQQLQLQQQPQQQSASQLSLPMTSSSSAAPAWTSTASSLDTEAKFGIFYDHFKPQFWWWEIQVCSRACIFIITIFLCMKALTAFEKRW